MSNPKMKSENYQNLGGINTKVSQYQNTPMEFLDMKNFDFQTPNALTERWGSTQYVSQAFGSPISSLYEFSRLNGSSYVIVGASGSLFYGATTGNSQGMSFGLMGQTTALTYAFSVHTFNFKFGLGGGPVAESVNTFYQGASQYILDGSGASSPNYFVNPISIGASAPYSYTTNQNEMFGANGNNYFKFDGTSTWPVGLPFATGFTSRSSASPGAGSTFSLFIGQTYLIGSSTIKSLTTGSYYFYGSYVNNRGFESQIWPLFGVDYTQYSTATNTGLTGTLNTLIGAQIYPMVSVNTPLAYGISSINIYYFYSPTMIILQGTSPTGASSFDRNYDGFLGAWNKPYVLLGNFPASGSTFTDVSVGTTSPAGQAEMVQNIGLAPNTNSNNYFPLGVTLQLVPSTGNKVLEIDQPQFFPKYVSTHKDRIFASGFSASPSTVTFSDVGEPEGYNPLGNFEVRTNDGDYITAQVPYLTKIYFFKKNSFHALAGDGPQNYFLQEMSTIYGCLNNNCVVIYNDMMLFLDQKGIMMFNGASVDCISNKVQDIFDRMNYSAALGQARGVHDKLRNQVLFAIPVDGSSVNNLTVVYDYLVQAFTTYEGVDRVTALARIQGRNNLKSVFFGTASGVVNWYGPSFLTDNGAGITGFFKTRFNNDMGESTEKQYRRLFLNADATGSTLAMPLNFYQDYGPSVVYSTTFLLGEFQNRIDFGIPAKSLAFELVNMTTTSRLRIYGFTFEHRLQRRV